MSSTIIAIARGGRAAADPRWSRHWWSRSAHDLSGPGRTAAPTGLEQELLARWTEEQLFEQTLEATRDGASRSCSSRARPPPTASPGIHHVFARTIKDLICRFQRDAGAVGDPHRGLGHPRPAGGDRGREAAQAQRQEGDRGVRRRGVQPRSAARASSPTRPTGKQLSNRIGYWLDYEHAVRHLHQRVRRVGLVAAAAAASRRTCCTAATGCCRTARAAARCCRATSWRWATRRSRTSRST